MPETDTRHQDEIKEDIPQTVEIPQVVRDFGNDKLSQNAKSASIIARHIINNGIDQFTGQDVLKVVIEHTGVDFTVHYTGTSYSESPLHRGLNALCKEETNQTIEGENGEIIDATARGQRFFLKKEGRVGYKATGFYMKNPEIEYLPVELSELQAACESLVSNISKRRKGE